MFLVLALEKGLIWEIFTIISESIEKHKASLELEAPTEENKIVDGESDFVETLIKEITESQAQVDGKPKPRRSKTLEPGDDVGYIRHRLFKEQLIVGSNAGDSAVNNLVQMQRDDYSDDSDSGDDAISLPNDKLNFTRMVQRLVSNSVKLSSNKSISLSGTLKTPLDSRDSHPTAIQRDKRGVILGSNAKKNQLTMVKGNTTTESKDRPTLSNEDTIKRSSMDPGHKIFETKEI